MHVEFGIVTQHEAACALPAFEADLGRVGTKTPRLASMGSLSLSLSLFLSLGVMCNACVVSMVQVRVGGWEGVLMTSKVQCFVCLSVYRCGQQDIAKDHSERTV